MIKGFRHQSLNNWGGGGEYYIQNLLTFSESPLIH